MVSRSEARGAHRRSGWRKSARGPPTDGVVVSQSTPEKTGRARRSTGRAREEIRARSRDRRRHPIVVRRAPGGCGGAGARKRRGRYSALDEVSETGRPRSRARTHKRPVGTRRDVLSHCAPRVAMDGEGGGTVTRAALRGRGHLGGAGRYIEMDRMDRIRLMEEGARSLQRNHAEHLGGAIETEDADRAHARLKRMAAFDSHNYDPTDNDLEEQALRARKRSSYHAEEKWKWGWASSRHRHGPSRLVDGLIDKLNAFKFGSTTGLIASRVAAFHLAHVRLHRRPLQLRRRRHGVLRRARCGPHPRAEDVFNVHLKDCSPEPSWRNRRHRLQHRRSSPGRRDPSCTAAAVGGA